MLVSHDCNHIFRGKSDIRQGLLCCRVLRHLTAKFGKVIIIAGSKGPCLS